MSEQENVNSSEAEVIQEPKVYSEEQFKGLLADKQAEVKKRQDLERQVAELTAGQDRDDNPTPGDDGGNSSDNDRPLTIGEFKSLMAEQRKSDAEAEFALRDRQSREKAVSTLTAEKCGDGLDFDSVVSAGTANLTEGDELAIRKAKDPADERYRRCLMLTPELREKKEALETAKLLEEI
ncbi:MAG: hypothetical protein KAR47_04310, partial [Planctomycetes bacterium]|nr:hypothetical protein [Planctomycetota bacterium]